MKKSANLVAFDKYDYYIKSVQSPEAEAEFMASTYTSLRKKQPKTLREDFCGTFSICCEWVKASPRYLAIGIDNDPEPLSYGKKHYLSKLTPAQQKRVSTHEMSVLDDSVPKSDIVCALNFSYFCFKKRSQVKEYFTQALATLNKQGLLVLDCFGGSKCYESNLEETYYENHKFSYFWDQDSFNPITHEVQFYIHFKRKGEKRREKVFSYDWRLWSIPELKDILLEVGFKDVLVYWEGTDRKGEGNGKFSPTTKGEECESWVAYLVALK